MVLPVGADVLIEPRTTIRTGGPTGLTPTAEAGLASLGVATSGLSEKRLRCTEGFLLPDEDLYVLGTAQENRSAAGSDNAARLFIGRADGGDFLISDRGEQALLASLRWKTVVSLYGGPALAAACLWTLLSRYVTTVP